MEIYVEPYKNTVNGRRLGRIKVVLDKKTFITECLIDESLPTISELSAMLEQRQLFKILLLDGTFDLKFTPRLFSSKWKVEVIMHIRKGKLTYIGEFLTKEEIINDFVTLQLQLQI